MKNYHSYADLGGSHINGAIVPEAEGELFHAEWERRVFALTLAMGATGSWNIDESRAARETLPNYRRLSYYQVWLAGLEKLLLERGLVHADELAAEQSLHPAAPVARVLKADAVAPALARGSPTVRPTIHPSRFCVGQAVRTRKTLLAHHSRVPDYTRGKRGVIERLHGCHVFADSNAHRLGEQAQWLYTVVFDGAELWGIHGAQGIQVSIDAWENTLEPE